MRACSSQKDLGCIFTFTQSGAGSVVKSVGRYMSGESTRASAQLFVLESDRVRASVARS